MALFRNVFLLILLTRASLEWPLVYTSAAQGGFSAGAALNAIVLALGFLALIARRRPGFLAPLAIWGPYLAIAAFSLGYSPDLSSGLRLFLNLFSYAAIFFAAFYFVRTEHDMALVAKAILLSAVVPILFGFVDAVRSGWRVHSTFTHPNIFAFYIVVLLAVVLLFRSSRLGADSRFWTIAPVALFPPLMALLLLTETRSAWAAALLILGVYAIAVNRAFALVLLVAIPVLLSVPLVSKRLSDLGAETQVEDLKHGEALNSHAWRQALWEYALEDSADARQLGKGLGSFRYNAPSFFPLEESADAHSGYVQAIYETGFVGFALYVGVYLGVALGVWRHRAGNERAVVIVLALIAANLMFNYSDNVPYYLAYNWYVWALLGAAFAFIRNARRARRATAVNDRAALIGARTVGV